jgi:hypothetical protein
MRCVSYFEVSTERCAPLVALQRTLLPRETEMAVHALVPRQEGYPSNPSTRMTKGELALTAPRLPKKVL